MANGLSMEDVAFYAKVGPENLKKLGSSSEAAVFQLIVKDTTAGSGCSYSELVAVSGFPAWMVNESIGSLSGKGFITTDEKASYSIASVKSEIPASVIAANEAAAVIPSAGKEFSPPDIFIPSFANNSDLPPEIANAISNAPASETIDSHAKKDAKKDKKDKPNMMNLIDGLATGRLIDHIGDKNDFGTAMQDVGGNVGSMMEGLSLKMPSVPMGGERPSEEEEDNNES